MKKVLLVISVLCFISCEKKECPEGTYEWNDAQGNFIDCVDFGLKTYESKTNFITILSKKPKFKISDEVVILNN